MSNDHPPFSNEELARYSRHLSLAEVGVAGQAKLKNASVLLIGLGGLGSPLSLYLTAVGIGRLGVVEFDSVDASNLQRQVLYGSSQVGMQKLACGLDRLRDLNPHVTVEEHPFRLTRENARETVCGYDIVADGADNFATRYLVNDACVLEKRPLVSASILGFEGQMSVYGYAGGPCYRCLYSEPPPPGAVPSCAEGGVLGVLPGVMGALQATEVIKLVLGIGDVASGTLIHYDALAAEFEKFRFPKKPECAVCGLSPTITELVDYEAFCGLDDATDRDGSDISAELLHQRLKTDGEVVLVDVREGHERIVDALPNSIHVPLDELLESGLNCPKDAQVIVYCQSGARSLRATESLIRRGFSNVKSLRSGLIGWRRVFPRR